MESKIGRSRISTLQVEEYKSCRNQIAENIKIMEQLETYCVAAVAAILVFALAQKSEFVMVSAIMIAVYIPLHGYLRFYALDRLIRTLNDYLEKIEQQHPEIGWTSFYRAKRSKNMWLSRHIFWFLIIFFTIGLEILVLTRGIFWSGGAA